MGGFFLESNLSTQTGSLCNLSDQLNLLVKIKIISYGKTYCKLFEL